LSAARVVAADFKFYDAAADRRMAETGRLAAYLPSILLYPVSGHALPALVMFTGFLWAGLQNVFGIALLAIVSPWLFHYAEAVIDRTAHGQATPPPFGGDMIFLGGVRAFRPLFGVGLIAAAFTLAQPHGPVPAALTLVAGALLFPAFMLVLTVENSLVAAVNPLQLFPAIFGVGSAYLAVCGILATAAAAAVWATGTLATLGILFVCVYVFLMSCHLLGYVAFHRAAQLGFSVRKPAVTDEVRKLEEQQARLERVLQKVDAALAEKDLQRAADVLRAEPGGPADLRLFHEELFEQITARHRPELVHEQGQRLITVLIRDKRLARALDIAETCYDAHRDFQPAQPGQAVTLAEQALLLKRGGLFERLTGDAAERYPAQAAAVSLAFLSARYWCEQRQDDGRARELLKPLLAATAHPQHRQIAAYARALAVG
jgi:hypothetical protein